jgi:F0F1-type ATP synthase delta subunit
MQELIQSQKIMDDDRKQVILEILADKYCKLILHFLLALYIEDYRLYMMQNYLLFLAQSIRMEKNTFYTRVE